MQRQATKRVRFVRFCSVLTLTVPAILAIDRARAEQPPPPCHPNPTADADEDAVRRRGDIASLPDPLKDRLARLANRPHTYLPMQTFAEADEPSRLFQYYLLDTKGFEPNVFTAIIPGVNDANVQLTVTGGNCGLPTVGSVRVVLEPKPGLPTDPNDPRAFNDVFTDISPMFVINNESGWYEGWMIHDITVPAVDEPRPDGHARFGTMTAADAKILQKMGDYNATTGNIFTMDGKPPRFPSASDHFPGVQTNVVPIHESMGLTTPCNSRTSTPIGSSTIWARTGSTRFMNCRSRVAFRTTSDSLPRPSKMGKSASCSRSFPARDRKE